MKRFLSVFALFLALAFLPGCSLFGSNDNGGDSSGGGGESETTMLHFPDVVNIA